jgi:hypothetical protein
MDDDLRGLFPCILESISIFSSFSSNKSFNSLTSDSSCRTRSSSDSVYPRGKARRLSLSLVRHSKPTLAHCEQHGRMPSHRIFLLRQRSQAWAIRLWELVPTLMTFIGRIPGILAVFDCPSSVESRTCGFSLMFNVGVEMGRKRDLDKRCLSFVGAQPVISEAPKKQGVVVRTWAENAYTASPGCNS